MSKAMIVIVPNSLRDAINAKLDEAFKTCPEAEKKHESLYHQLLECFDEHGVIPDFTLTSNVTNQTRSEAEITCNDLFCYQTGLPCKAENVVGMRNPRQVHPGGRVVLHKLSTESRWRVVLPLEDAKPCPSLKQNVKGDVSRASRDNVRPLVGPSESEKGHR